MYQTLNIHNSENGNIKITFWHYPEGGGAKQEVIETGCGYVAVTETDGFKVDSISVSWDGVLLVDINIGKEAGNYVTELKDFPDSEPPFKCLRIEKA